MKVTRIVEQTKYRGRYAIFVDGAYAFSLSETVLLESGLTLGSELSATELAKWRRRSAEGKQQDRALRYVLMRPRSTGEVRVYLRQKGTPPGLVEQILNKLSKAGLLDDEAFAKSFVESRRLRPTSRLKLQQHLRAKHLGDEIIEQALDAERSTDQEALRVLIAKKMHLLRFRQSPQKLMQYLARQGFGYDDIKTALEKVTEEDSEAA